MQGSTKLGWKEEKGKKEDVCRRFFTGVGRPVDGSQGMYTSAAVGEWVRGLEDEYRQADEVERQAWKDFPSAQLSATGATHSCGGHDE